MSLLKTTSDGAVLTICFVQGKMLDAAVLETIQDELLTTLKKAEEPNVLLDFHSVRFLSSAALGMLVRAQKRCRESNVNLILCNMLPAIYELFQITGLDKVLRICADSDEAERAFTKKGRGFRYPPHAT